LSPQLGRGQAALKTVDLIEGHSDSSPRRHIEASHMGSSQQAHPCHGLMRAAQELRGIQVSSGNMRGVRQRHGLLTKHERGVAYCQAVEQIALIEFGSPAQLVG
jgi:hypothetical protein